MTLDEAIKRYYKLAEEYTLDEFSFMEDKDSKKLAEEYKQVAEWLTELKEAKRLLKAAVEDMTKEADCGICLHDNDSECPIKVTACKFKWRYADEALALIGEDTNVPASADDTNVGHKSGDWISVNDRLPEAVEEDVNGKIAFSKSVLVYLVYDNGFTYITNDRFRVDSKSWLHEIPGEGCKVTHWMPIPEPPKDGEQNE